MNIFLFLIAQRIKEDRLSGARPDPRYVMARMRDRYYNLSDFFMGAVVTDIDEAIVTTNNHHDEENKKLAKEYGFMRYDLPNNCDWVRS